MESTVNLELLRKVKENIIGHNTEFLTPFGLKRLLYCDYTASGKALDYIERFIYDNVYPYYANTHSATSISGQQTTAFREESRDIIRKAVNAGPEDVMIFTGSGTTAAIHKIINVLDLRPPKTEHTVVIIGPYEHHSNILPWKETGVWMERVRENNDGTVDQEDLERHLRDYFHRGFWIIVTMSAASNVTGIVTDTDAITRLVHKYGGLAFWDYATAAPYLPINVNPALDCSKDAVFISPHKFVGGVGTPGLLIAKRKLFNNHVPDKCGGGTVTWVTQQGHEYSRDIEEREEGGTPAIVESIRAGLAFQVKSLIGEEALMRREEALCRRALSRWRGNPCLQLLGSYSATRLPIFSFLVHQPRMDKYLHHNLVAVLLNDLYGIQVRGGCACAGPYAQDLLDMDEDAAMVFVRQFLSQTRGDSGKEVLGVMKPGFVRLNIPYFLDDDCVEFILKAVETVAREGWKLLPLYTFDKHTGQWRHRRESKHKLTRLQDASLGHVSKSANTPLRTTPPKKTTHHHPIASITPGRSTAAKKLLNHVQATPARSPLPKKPLTYKSLLRDARKVLDNYQRLASNSDAHTDELLVLETHDQNLLWFLQPREVYDFIFEPEAFDSPDRPLPFRPRRRSSTYSYPPLLHVPNLPGSPELTDEELNRACNSPESVNCQRSNLDDNSAESLSPVHQSNGNGQMKDAPQPEPNLNIQPNRDEDSQPENENERDSEGAIPGQGLESAHPDSEGSISDHESSITPPNPEEKLHMFLESTSSGDSAFIQSMDYNEEDGFDALFSSFRRIEDQAIHDSHAYKTPTRHRTFSDARSRETELRGCSSLLKIEENYYSPIAPRKHIRMEDASTSPVADPYALLPPVSTLVCNQLTLPGDSVKTPGKTPVKKPVRDPFIEGELDGLKLRPPIKNLMKTICPEATNVEKQTEWLNQDQDKNQTVAQDHNEQMNKDRNERMNKDPDEHVAQDQKERVNIDTKGHVSKDQNIRPTQDQECVSSDDDQLNMSLVSLKTSGEEEDNNESMESGKKKQKKRTKKQKKKKKELCTIM